MEDTFSLILHACELARDLESNLPNIANKPLFLLRSCEEVSKAFDEAIHVLRSQRPSPHTATHMLFGDVGVGEGSSHGGARGLEDDIPFFFYDPPEIEMGQSEMPELGLNVQATPSMGMLGLGTGSRGGGGVAATMKDRSSSRRRREGSEECTMRVPAPHTGNTEIPHDGYTWRKYGQKDILGCKFPRSYYRCTHKNFYGCEAKKQLQRLDEDPYTYEVTYRGKHSCQTSPTPLILPSLSPAGDNQGGIGPMPEGMPPPLSLSTSRLAHWFSMELEGGRREFHGGESSNAIVGSSDVQGGKDEDWPVAGLTDAMFNSGSSGSSMDAFFSMKQEEWKDKDA